jgi:hypothetical protein
MREGVFFHLFDQVIYLGIRNPRMYRNSLHTVGDAQSTRVQYSRYSESPN